MTAHSIVYIVLSLLSLVAVHALGSPTNNESTREQHQTENTEESVQETP